ncbi:NLI interacting factor-like phosphatase [compost metagenome]
MFPIDHEFAKVYALYVRLTKDENALSLLNNGLEKFNEGTSARIIRDHVSEIFFNYCPNCGKLARTLIIDDTTEKSMLNYANAIQIAEFTGNPNDNELLLATYLEKLKKEENIRQIDKRIWRDELKSTNQ